MRARGGAPSCAARHPLRRQPVEKVVVTEDRSAALLIRVWFEDWPEQFRARLTAVAGPGAGTPEEDLTVAVASSRSEVLDAVRDWLDDVGSHRPVTD
jgi:hypothetical protein